MSKYRVHKSQIRSAAAVLAAIEDRILQRMLRGVREDQREARRAEFAALAHQVVADSVRVHLDKPVPLYGYKGDRREEHAHIRIPKEIVNRYMGGGASNDVGFYKGSEGFEAIVSEYDRSAWWSQAEDRFWQIGAVTEAAELAQINGYAVAIEETSDGMIQLICDSNY